MGKGGGETMWQLKINKSAFVSLFAKAHHIYKESQSCPIVEWEIITNNLNLCHAERDRNVTKCEKSKWIFTLTSHAKKKMSVMK